MIETLVVFTIIATLLSILLPALTSARDAVKELHCSSNLKTVAMEFEFFAEGESRQGRGDSRVLGPKRFWIQDFQESLYGLDEFWDAPTSAVGDLRAGTAAMLCPAGAPQLQKRSGLPCGNEAIGPAQDVSIAMNMRLYRAVIEFQGRRVLAPAASTQLRPRILHHSYVPLALDVDGKEAARRGLEPFYTAPPIASSTDPYSDGRYWMPSGRHRGKTNAAFVGGHVLSSARPGQERWDWKYQAEVGR